MNDYIGKTCPYCKTVFTADDDIVVCSVCDMPHHKDCWIENKGCTTFGCTGTIKNADGTATTVTTSQMNYDDSSNAGFVFCTSCGARNSNSNAFCERCGNKLTAPVTQSVPRAPFYTQAGPNNTNPYAYVNQRPAQTHTYTQNTPPNTSYDPLHSNQTSNVGYNGQQSYQTHNTGYNGQQSYQSQNAYQPGGFNAGQAGVSLEVQRLVGPKTEYYVPRFQEIKARNKIVGWNWAGFWLGPFWMMYRKMYAYAAAVLGTTFLISLINSPFLTFLAGGISVAIGLFGDTIYFKGLENKANQARNLTEPYKTENINKNGGVNTLAAVLSGVGYGILVMLVMM